MSTRTSVAAGTLVGLLLAAGTTMPASAEAGVEQAVYVEDFQGTTRAYGFDGCVGYAAQIYEDRSGSYQVTVHTRGGNAGAANVVGTVDADFVLSPVSGPGSVFTGTYREQSAGTFTTVDEEDVPFPSGTFLLEGSGRSADGTSIRFTAGGHFVVDKRTGAVRRTVEMGTCQVR